MSMSMHCHHTCHIRFSCVRSVQVLGIVSDDVAQAAEGFKQGNTDIVESGHTLVLNVNSTTEDMLRQVCVSANLSSGTVACVG